MYLLNFHQMASLISELPQPFMQDHGGDLQTDGSTDNRFGHKISTNFRYCYI